MCASSMTATVTFWGIIVTVSVVDDGGGHVFGYFCNLTCRGLAK